MGAAKEDSTAGDMQKEEKMNRTGNRKWRWKKDGLGKRIAALALGVMLAMGTLAGCGSEQAGQIPSGSEASRGLESNAQESSPAASSTTESSTAASDVYEPATVRVGSLKGPTSMGILFLMDKAEQGETADNYEFQMATGADELLPLMIKGELDIALVPANVAAVLYQKTDAGVSVVDINTLGVLYAVTGAPGVESVSDLKGKTIYLTGKGTTPEASLRYILQENGLTESDYTLEFKSEATEVAAMLAENPDAIGVLPQPFVTAAMLQNQSLQIVLDLNEEWMQVENEIKGGKSNGMVTGVTVVRDAFLEEHPEAVKRFLEEHASSVSAINEDAEAGAALAVEAGIVAKEPIARKAIPNCNIVCVTGEEMKADLSAYLQVLAEFKPELVGGKAPEEDFYYIP